MMNSFVQCWSAVRLVPPGTPIAPWSVAGRAKTTFHVLQIGPASIAISPADGDPREIPKADFQKVYDVWSDYKTGKVKRYQLGFTQNSVYIIGILHHIGM